MTRGLARRISSAPQASVARKACQLRIPTAEAWLPARDDALGNAAVAALDELRLPLRDLLRRPVASIYRKDHE